jgi:hypothetical protein
MPSGLFRMPLNRPISPGFKNLFFKGCRSHPCRQRIFTASGQKPIKIPKLFENLPVKSCDLKSYKIINLPYIYKFNTK